MFNFTDLVADIILEQDPPAAPENTNTQGLMNLQGFKELRNAYTTQYGKTPDVNEILKAVNIVTGGNYIAAKYANIGYMPFIDAFAQSYALIDNKDKGKFTQAQIVEALLENPEIFDPIFSTIAAAVKNTKTVSQYEPSNPDVNRAWRSLTSEANKLSQTAIQSLGADTVHSAITKIIAKRIPVMDRIVGLKGLVRPFNASVITPILHQFKKYTGYKQGDFKKNPTGWLKDRLWPNKVPGDFNKMVEDITANNLLNVAVLAYEYYIYLLSTQGQPLYTQNQQQTQTVNASLDIFDGLINSLLNEDMPPWLQGPSSIRTPAQSQSSSRQLSTDPRNVRRREQRKKARETKQQTPQTQISSGLPQEQIEKIANQVGTATDPDYTSFIDKGESRYLPGIKFDLNTISKDPSREAQALYKGLTDMAYFTRTTKPGDRIKAAQGVAQSIWDMSGHRLYN
jgi:hypothetical protein